MFKKQKYRDIILLTNVYKILWFYKAFIRALQNKKCIAVNKFLKCLQIALVPVIKIKILDRLELDHIINTVKYPDHSSRELESSVLGSFY